MDLDLDRICVILANPLKFLRGGRVSSEIAEARCRVQVAGRWGGHRGPLSPAQVPFIYDPVHLYTFKSTLSEIRRNNQVVNFTFIFPCKYAPGLLDGLTKNMDEIPFHLGATSQDEDCPVEGLQEWLNDLRAKLGWVFGGTNLKLG